MTSLSKLIVVGRENNHFRSEEDYFQHENNHVAFKPCVVSRLEERQIFHGIVFFY